MSDRYRILRECGAGQAGDLVELAPETAEWMVRDGMAEPADDPDTPKRPRRKSEA